jgi:hypothetical protein
MDYAVGGMSPFNIGKPLNTRSFRSGKVAGIWKNPDDSIVFYLHPE